MGLVHFVRHSLSYNGLRANEKEAKHMTKSAVEMVKEAKTRITNLTAEQVASELAKGNAVLVDLREPEERIQNGAIPGAISAPRGMLEFYADPTSAYHRPEFDPAHRIILYC